MIDSILDRIAPAESVHPFCDGHTHCWSDGAIRAYNEKWELITVTEHCCQTCCGCGKPNPRRAA